MSELEQLRIENLRLREALELIVKKADETPYSVAERFMERAEEIAIQALNPPESCDTCKNNGNTRGECQNESCNYEPREALNATPASTEWLDKLVMERLGEPVAWITKDATDDLEHQGSAVCYVSDIPEIHMEPLYRLTSGKEGK